MQTDQDLAELFERAVAGLTPDVTGLVGRSEKLGRRLRRRIRFSRTAGSAMTVALATAAVSTAGAWPFHAHPAAPSGTSGTRPTASSGGARHPTVKQPLQQIKKHAEAAKPMTGRHMLRVLRSLMPADSALSTVALGTERGSLEVKYDDGHGPADVMIAFGPFSPEALTCPNPLWTDEGTRPAGALPISCAVRTPPGGGVERDAVMYADEYGFYGYDIYVQRPDGFEIMIQVANGYFDPYLPHVDRPTPPGSMALWESVIESPAWQS